MDDIERERISKLIAMDLLDAVDHLYGPDGLGKVVERMKQINRARDDRAEMDALDEMFSTMAKQ